MRLGTVFTLSDSEMDNIENVFVWLKPSDRYIKVWHLVVGHKTTILGESKSMSYMWVNHSYHTKFMN